MSKIFRTFLENEVVIRRIFARYCPRKEDIEELTQETFLKGFSAEMVTEIREPKAFLLRVAKNLALSEVKKKFRTTTDYIEDFDNPDALRPNNLKDGNDITVEDQVDGKRKLAALTKAIASLPPQHRRALLMKKVEHLKFKQIAMRLNVSVSTVEKRVATGLLMCNSYLRKQGYDMAEFGTGPILAAARPATDNMSTSSEKKSGRTNDLDRCDYDG